MRQRLRDGLGCRGGDPDGVICGARGRSSRLGCQLVTMVVRAAWCPVCDVWWWWCSRRPRDWLYYVSEAESSCLGENPFSICQADVGDAYGCRLILEGIVAVLLCPPCFFEGTLIPGLGGGSALEYTVRRERLRLFALTCSRLRVPETSRGALVSCLECMYWGVVLYVLSCMLVVTSSIKRCESFFR